MRWIIRDIAKEKGFGELGAYRLGRAVSKSGRLAKVKH
jgi:hypothetical protein